MIFYIYECILYESRYLYNENIIISFVEYNLYVIESRVYGRLLGVGGFLNTKFKLSFQKDYFPLIAFFLVRVLAFVG